MSEMCFTASPQRPETTRLRSQLIRAALDILRQQEGERIAIEQAKVNALMVSALAALAHELREGGE